MLLLLPLIRFLCDLLLLVSCAESEMKNYAFFLLQLHSPLPFHLYEFVYIFPEKKKEISLKIKYLRRCLMLCFCFCCTFERDYLLFIACTNAARSHDVHMIHGDAKNEHF